MGNLQPQNAGTNGITKKYLFKLTKAELEDLVAKKTLVFQKKSKISGFRPGHVPLDIVQKHHMSDIIEQSIFDHLDKQLLQEVRDNEYNLATKPVVSTVKYSDKVVDDVEISVTLEMMPKMPDIALSRFAREIPKLQCSEQEIQNELQLIANSYASVEEIQEEDHSIANGEIADINFNGKLDGVEFDGGKAENYLLEIGSKTFVDNFESQLEGLKKNDTKEVRVTFPQKYQQKNLAGQRVVFDVKINRIFKKVLPEIDEQFATKVGAKDLNSLKTSIQENLDRIMKHIFVSRVKSKLIAEILAAYEFEVPPSMLEQEQHAILHRHHNHEHDEDCNHEQDNISDEQKKEAKQEALHLIRTSYLLNYLREKYEVKISKQDLDQFILHETILQGLSDPNQLMELYKTNEQAKRNLDAMMVENKIIATALEHITYNQITVNKDEYQKILVEMQKS